MLRRLPSKRSVVALAIAASLAGCVTSAALREARRAEERQDYDVAVVEFTRAVQGDPAHQL